MNLIREVPSSSDGEAIIAQWRAKFPMIDVSSPTGDGHRRGSQGKNCVQLTSSTQPGCQHIINSTLHFEKRHQTCVILIGVEEFPIFRLGPIAKEPLNRIKITLSNGGQK